MDRIYAEGLKHHATYRDHNLLFEILDDPKAREARPEQFLDNSYLRELETSGFVGQLYDTPR